MRVFVQRVWAAQVAVDERIVGAIGPGLLLLVGLEADDGASDLDWMCGKLLRLRIFADENGVMNHDVCAAGGEILAVSQFTLFASTRKGNRPSWGRAAPGSISQPLFERFVGQLAAGFGRAVPTGVFGADMQVSLQNDGPVSLLIDSRARE